ncbi:ankyrin [Aspergillus eucalypticola CBS 122712]|uniref:Ankyrin n=1 Tax=Aspergillus eucalypticola (strain CBS 122712 / IBT 29274) TaxID=1448314 RepID=A0A317VW40_ASPEC|nr:ankyrin [Aspergillus eucalypticola CBS 122712]PWY78606.1 ankyrin [Aspergillus eucalypticola CBS 122712]
MADNCEVTKLLLISGANIEAQADSDQRRPIHLAAVRGSMALLNLLCDKGASLDARDAAGDRALCVASRYGHAAAVQNLLDRGSPVCLSYGVRSEEDSPLCLAAMGGHVPVVTLLLQRGASAIKRDERGWQPYRYAAYYGHPNALRLLMSCSLMVAKDDADLGLTAERIGFAPSADISIERKREVQRLLYQMQHPSQPGAEGSPVWSSPLKPNQQHPVPSGFMSDAAVYHIQPSPTAETNPQELPGTLEQGLPASRSQTPEHMRRGSSVYQRIDSEFRDVPQILEANERAFAPTNEQIAMPQARHYFEVPRGNPSPSNPCLESVFSHAGERAGVRTTDSPVSLTDVYGLNPARASWTVPLSHADGEAQNKEREWDTESSISSVYTAPEEDVAELAA